MDYTKSRYIPQGSAKVANRSGSAVAYLYTSPTGKPAVIGYWGKGGKPTIHYRYATPEHRAEAVAQFLRAADDSVNRKTARMAERRAKLAQPHGLAVGDVLSCSWGYDQTNVEYFEVVRLIGARSVEIREIAHQSEETGFMSGVCVPAKGHYIGKPMTKRVGENGEVKVHSFAWARKLEPRRVGGVEIFTPDSWTAYA